MSADESVQGEGSRPVYDASKLEGIRKGQFGYGRDPRERLLNRSEPAADQQPGEFDLLAAMLHVITRPAREDVTQGQKVCREWRDRDVKDFMKQFAMVEAARAADKKKAEVVEESDLGSDRCEEMIEKLLAEWEASDDSS
jgi:hypothetical protein